MPTASGGIMKPIEGGQVVDNYNPAQENQSKINNSLDKDAFLQLLVTQMKYQDPLEPTSNTEYISQLATFSSLEEMQNLNQSVKDNQATGLVGKQVIMKSVNPITGVATYASGRVDYVLRQNGKTFLAIEEGLYPIEDLDTVVDEEYLDAVTLADTFEKMMAVMPGKNQLTLADKNLVTTAREAYDSMTAYQKKFVNPTYLTKLEELEERVKELEAAAEADGSGETGGSNEDGGSDGSDSGEV